MKPKSSISFTLVIVKLIIFNIFLFGICIVGFSFYKINIDKPYSIIEALVFLSLFYLLLRISFQIKKILYTIKNRNPFVLENITRFKSISNNIFLFGIIDAVFNYRSRKNSGMALLATSTGSFSSCLYF